MKGHLVQVNGYMALSGRHWDPVIGANIEGPSAVITFGSDVKQFPIVSITSNLLLSVIFIPPSADEELQGRMATL